MSEGKSLQNRNFLFIYSERHNPRSKKFHERRFTYTIHVPTFFTENWGNNLRKFSAVPRSSLIYRSEKSEKIEGIKKI